MTDRIGGLLVVVDEPLRDDDSRLLALQDAIRQMVGVVSVTQVAPSDNHAELQAALRVETKWRSRIVRHVEQMIAEG